MAERVRSPLHPWLRPSGVIGQSAGILALAIFLFLWLYPLRKKVKALAWTGSVGRWLDVHVMAALTLPLLLAIHAAWRFDGVIGLGYTAILLVCASGVIGRYLYSHIPRARSGVELSRDEVAAQYDVLAADRRESLQREGHQVGARPQIDDTVKASVIGHDHADLFDERICVWIDPNPASCKSEHSHPCRREEALHVRGLELAKTLAPPEQRLVAHLVLLRDLRDRRAIGLAKHAIDRGLIVDRVYWGQGRPATGPVSHLMKWAHTDNVRQYAYDPAEAMRLLEDAVEEARASRNEQRLAWHLANLALAARAAGVPFIAAGPSSSIDLRLPTGTGIEIEERDADEVRAAAGALLTIDGTPCRNPAFDVTPAELVWALVTERGAARPVTADTVARVA